LGPCAHQDCVLGPVRHQHDDPSIGSESAAAGDPVSR
jgi:hypothetical protein